LTETCHLSYQGVEKSGRMNTTHVGRNAYGMKLR